MPRPRPSRLRRLRQPCLFLLLGLVTTVAVAWALELRPSERRGRRSDREAQRAWVFSAPPQWRLEGSGEKWFLGRTSRFAWGFPFPERYFVDEYSQAEFRNGFPLKSLMRRATFADQRGREESNDGMSLAAAGVSLRADVDPTRWDSSALPLLPIWPGLAGNTAFYAMLWWLALASLRSVRQNRRFHRGFCPSCRYDLKADYAQGCSECGWAR